MGGDPASKSIGALVVQVEAMHLEVIGPDNAVKPEPWMQDELLKTSLPCSSQVCCGVPRRCRVATLRILRSVASVVFDLISQTSRATFVVCCIPDSHVCVPK